MQNKLLMIVLIILSASLVSVQHHAKSVRDSINPQQEIPVLTVNINQATAIEIAEVLVGIGLSKASLIVTHRKTNGPFKTMDQLLDVKGIGPKTLEKNRAKITF